MIGRGADGQLRPLPDLHAVQLRGYACGEVHRLSLIHILKRHCFARRAKQAEPPPTRNRSVW